MDGYGLATDSEPDMSKKCIHDIGFQPKTARQNAIK